MCLAVAPAAAAASPQKAADYYNQATQAYEDGEYARAATLLERAYAEQPDLMYQYNRILALQALGNVDEALDVLEAYQNPMRDDGRFENIDKLRVKLEKAQARPAAPKSPTASEESKPATAATEQPPASPPDNQPGPRPQTDNAGRPAPTADDTENIVGWSLVGAGALGLGAAGLFGSAVLIPDVADRRSCLQSADATPAKCYGDVGGRDARRAQYEQDKSTWSTHQTLTWVSLGVGAAAVIGGTTVLLMGRSDTDVDGSTDAARSSIRVSPYVGADAAGGIVQISF